MKIGVYGTLRKGMNNHVCLGDSKHVDTLRVPGWAMFTLGSFIPTIMYTGNTDDSVVLEVYDVVCPYTLKDLDALEGYVGEGKDNWYERTAMYHDKDGDVVHAYTWQAHVIKGGDYLEWRAKAK